MFETQIEKLPYSAFQRKEKVGVAKCEHLIRTDVTSLCDIPMNLKGFHIFGTLSCRMKSSVVIKVV